MSRLFQISETHFTFLKYTCTFYFLKREIYQTESTFSQPLLSQITQHSNPRQQTLHFRHSLPSIPQNDQVYNFSNLQSLDPLAQITIILELQPRHILFPTLMELSKSLYH